MHKLISLRGSRQAHIDFRFVIPARHTIISLRDSRQTLVPEREFLGCLVARGVVFVFQWKNAVELWFDDPQ